MPSTSPRGPETAVADGEPTRPQELPPTPRRGIWSSFQVAQFRWVFASNTTFFLAMGGQQVLRSWLVFQLTGSELSLGLISASVALPMLLIAPFGGSIADRRDRRS
ncbi:MAG: MFS transporter, partial [Thermoanaerobaculia bacterium]|nr:MFS transporter [Thermoanaerobaculia bacterium]